MNLVVEKQPKCVATLRVEIPAEHVSAERSKIVRGYTTSARIPGFRPGKAPNALVEKRYDKEITEELVEALVSEAYRQSLHQESLKVLDFGVPENLKFHDDGTLSFESRLTLSPEVQLPDYKGIPIQVPPLAVPDDELDQQLDSLRQQFAEYTDLEDRAAEMGDVAVIDYTSTVDGQPTDEFLGKSAGYLSGREGYWVRLDDNSFVPGFCQNVVGMSVGESRQITVTLPEDFPVTALAGKEIAFDTTLAGLKATQLPELDDAFAQRLSPDKTMDEIREIVRGNMEIERRRKIDDLKVSQIVSYLNEKVEFELPEELVTRETQNQADTIVERGIRSGMSEEEIAAQQEEIFASAGSSATTSLRANFILQEIGRVEGIEVSDNELVNHLATVAARQKVAIKKFIRDLQRSGRISGIRQSMTIGKVIDFLLEHATVEETSEATIDA
jgi:trigger factor